MADNKQSTLGNISDFSVLMDRLTIKNANKQNEKLNKNVENLNKSILSLAKKILPSTGLGESISDISRNRRTFDTFGTMLRNRMFGRNNERTFSAKFGNLRGAMNTFGIVKKGSGSLFDELLEKREVKNQFISDQFKVNPQMVDTVANRKMFGKKFDTQQVLQKELNSTQREIDRLKESGFTDKQIARSGLFKQRDSAAAKLAASDNRLYSKIKDEIVQEVKEGILDGIRDATIEAQQELKEMDKADKNVKRSNNPFAPKQSDEETAREEEEIQKGILKGQSDLLNAVKDIRDALNSDDPQFVDNRDSSTSGWLKGILGTISGFLISKMTGIVGMLTSGISTVLSPILKFLGVGKAVSVAGDLAGNAAKTAGGAVAKSGGFKDKIKGIIKSVAPKIGTATKFAAGLLLSKPAMIAAAAAGAGYLGYQLLPDSVKKTIDDQIAKFTGTDEPDTQLSKNIDNNLEKIEKTSPRIGDVLERKIQEVKELTNNTKTEAATIVNAPTTNNNSSTTNNHFKSSPRNGEPTYNKYVINRFAVN